MLRPAQLGLRTGPFSLRALRIQPAVAVQARAASSLSNDKKTTIQPPKDPGVAKGVPKLGRLQKYAPALAALAARTGVGIPALTASFLVLHEITAVLPVFGFYWALHALGIGAGVVAWLADVDSSAQGDGEGGGAGGWKRVVHAWYAEGARKVEYVGRRYGWLGYAKGSTMGAAPDAHAEEIVARDAGAVADAVAAYVIVKALLPLRLGVSLAAAPGFARFWARAARAVRRR